MKTHEEGYALGWADAIYAYESKQRKQMSTLSALMSLVDSYKCDRGTRWAIRDAIESALRRAEPEQAEAAVIASIPRELLENYERANAKFVAEGGCPGCGSLRIGVHTLPCSYCDEHPFD